MQPYVFPYVGYFQLINAVDHFVFYDDVNFIKQGWINRNRIFVNGSDQMFTIPINDISSFRPINETEINYKLYPKWWEKFKKTLSQTYKNSPFFEDVMLLVSGVFEKNYPNISALCVESIARCCSYLEMTEKNFYLSSERFGDTKGLDRADRLISISESLGSQDYINPAGGVELYDKEYFKSKGVMLSFMANNLTTYNQFNYPFVGGLSIIDVLMFNDKDEVVRMLDNFKLN